MNQLVVLLHKRDRVAEFLPYAAALARPGMTIFFLVHYSSRELPKVMDQLPMGWHSFDSDSHLVELADGEPEKASEMRALHQPGVEIKVSVYSGSARRALRQFVGEQPAGLLILHGGSGCALSRALRRIQWLARFFNRRAVGPSVVLAQTG